LIFYNRSRNPIETQKWHQLRIVKDKHRFKMYLDSDNVVISKEIIQMPSFNSNESLFIGGVKDVSKINKKFKLTIGLVGAIQRVNTTNLNFNLKLFLTII
jgi:hypothetical protein